MTASDLKAEARKNADRFIGFAEIYDEARPALPLYPVEIIKRYLGRPVETVIDLGCGTGLSTLIWKGHCQRAVGVEPSADMLALARRKEGDGLSFVQGSGLATGLEDHCADVVVCSQSFHWMEPEATLREVNRLLRSGGIFAAVDCDWPPISRWKADLAFDTFLAEVRKIEEENPEIKNTFARYPKDRHLANIRRSGYFRYAREILFANREECEAERYIRLALSLGGLRTILKKCPELISDDLQVFREAVSEAFAGHVYEMDFSYRLRLGVK